MVSSSSGIHPRFQLANALLCFQKAAELRGDESAAGGLRAQGADILKQALQHPDFSLFLEAVDTFERRGDLSPELLEATTTEDTCNIAHWDGTKMCLLRIAREHADPVERELAFDMFKDELVESCAVLNCLSERHLEMLLRCLTLMNPKEVLKDSLVKIWNSKKADSPCSYS